MNLIIFITLMFMCLFSQCREHVELENLRGEHSRMLEEAKKEKVHKLSSTVVSSFYKQLLNVHLFTSTSCCLPIS